MPSAISRLIYDAPITYSDAGTTMTLLLRSLQCADGIAHVADDGLVERSKFLRFGIQHEVLRQLKPEITYCIGIQREFTMF
jgi:hypothetical protein